MESADSDSGTGSNGPNVLDKERNLMNEDPKWQGELLHYRHVLFHR